MWNIESAEDIKRFDAAICLVTKTVDFDMLAKSLPWKTADTRALVKSIDLDLLNELLGDISSGKY